MDTIKGDGIYGAPDVAIEILSSNRTYDTKRKRNLYEKVGVKEYFMIDPENKSTTLLTLDASGLYQQTYEMPGVLKISSACLRYFFLSRHFLNAPSLYTTLLPNPQQNLLSISDKYRSGN